MFKQIDDIKMAVLMGTAKTGHIDPHEIFIKKDVRKYPQIFSYDTVIVLTKVVGL